MRISKCLYLLVLIVFLFGITSCGGGGKYSDSAQKVAAALTDFNKAMNDLRPKMEKMQEKYPELSDMAKPPTELGEEGEKMAEMMMKMGTVMMKAMQYSDDPAVQKAMEEFQKSGK
jgi:uncharacterized coiled-coil DUF342 family protein